MTYADRSLSGYPMAEGTTLVCGDESMHPVNNGYSEAQATPYGTTILFDATSGRSAGIRDRGDCERGAKAFISGPGRFGAE